MRTPGIMYFPMKSAKYKKNVSLLASVFFFPVLLPKIIMIMYNTGTSFLSSFAFLQSNLIDQALYKLFSGSANCRKGCSFCLGRRKFKRAMEVSFSGE